MNKKFLEIATKYEVAEENVRAILQGMKIKSTRKTPDDEQLEGFESICLLLKEGANVEAAISVVVEEAKKKSESEVKEVNPEPEIEAEGKAPSSSSNNNGRVKT